MEKDIEQVMQCYDRFLEIIEEISMSAKEQVSKLKGTVVADEIATDFSEIGMIYAKELLEYECITKEQFLIAKSIDESLNVMSQRKKLWNEDALLNAKEWEECRKKGKRLLLMLKK